MESDSHKICLVHILHMCISYFVVLCYVVFVYNYINVINIKYRVLWPKFVIIKCP
jgi:hypothetical protein